ncbi:uncharacterized protein LOC117398759 isoform X4 [Acipenser ruthenus]|uniref:uncharacterized protein LOC117398759 isoform X4 n=1 Tax=Acipenser ruthenus TaxID=7906 RepID=UPI0027418279|nr:uncharacterized protein LOC117398759 isoform X4 [Acipenser ruthenus]
MQRAVDFLFLLSCAWSRGEDSLTVKVSGSPLIVREGEDAVLPCLLLPTHTNAESLEVRWFRVEDSHVHTYIAHRDVMDGQSEPYKGRTSLFHEELRKGNVSLQLRAVRISDEGLYRCCVISGQQYCGEFELKLVAPTPPAQGSTPSVSLLEAPAGGGLSLLCVSEGWYPPPELLWTDETGADWRAHFTTNEEQDSTGLVTVRSQIHLPRQQEHAPRQQNTMICVVRSRDGVTELKTVMNIVDGSIPSVSLLEAPAGGGLSLLCVSEGWYPPPELLWTDEMGADWRAHFTTNEEQDSTGLVTVRSQIHLPRQQGHAPWQQNTMICVVRSRDGATELKTMMNITDGSTPSVSLLEDPARGGLSLLCVSEGWYPPPELLWTDETGADWRAHFTTNEEQDSTGLVTVRSQIHLPRQQGHAPRQQNTVICVVRSRDGATELKTVMNIADGSTPSVSLLEAPSGGGLILQCVSEGWYPPPELLWTDETGTDWRAYFTTNEEQDSTGLVTVRSQIHLPRQQGHAPRQQNTVICVVRSRDGATELKTVMNIADGSTPSVSLLEDPARGGLSLLCVSEGWYPPPELLWTDETGADWRAHFTTNEEQDSTGLVTVRSQIHLPRQQGHAPWQQNTMICVVRSRDGATELKTVMNIADGSTPSVSLLEAPAGGVLILLCVSEGWYPPPELLWTDETGADWRAHFTTNEEQDSTGLVTVRSQIHLPRQQGHAPRQQNTVICVVRSRDGATELKTVMNIADGSTPSVSLLEAPSGGGLILLCVSEGWYPPPELLWTDETGADWRAHFTTNEEQDSTGLVTVRSQIHLPRQQGHAPQQQNTVICVVRSRDGATELKTVMNIADGSTPSVSLLEDPARGGLSLLCVSEGWYPPPELLWTDETGADWRAHFTTNEEQDSTGLVTVRSQIHLPRQQGHAPWQQNTMICVVRSRDGATELKTVMNIADGSTPSVSLLEAPAGGVLILLCVSEGWYPPPELLWTDETGADWRAHFTTNEQQDSTGLVTVRSQIHLPWQQGHALQQQNTMICVVRSRDGATELKTVMNIAEDCDISMQWPVIASSILAAVICIPVLLYFTRKPTKDRLKRDKETLVKEKEDLQKQNETLKKEKRTAQEAPFTVDHHHKALNRDDEELQQDRKKEGLLEQNESLKKEKKNIEDEKEDLQKQNDHLKREKDALGKEKEDLQKQNDDLQGENKRLGKGKEDLQKDYDHLKREKDALGKEKEGLQKDYESLKKEKKNIEDEKEGLQKDYDHLKREKDALGKEKEDLQKQNGILKKEKEGLVKETFKKKNEIKTPTDNSKEGLENYIKMLQEDFEELRRKTNACGYVLDREWKKMTEARVNVTLDPDTASLSLKVSEDGSQVRFTGERSAEWPSVLGREGFTSGKHYWEVEVGEKGFWVLGVSTHPHEKSIPEKPGEGYWLVRLVKGKTYTAVSQSGDQILNLEKICKVWGVYLDHEGGRLSFCNALTRFHIHTLEGSFPGPVYPIFSPGSHDKGPLIIQRVQHTAANIN